MKLSSIHNKILQEKAKRLEAEIRKNSPKIQMQAIADEFKQWINSLKFKDRVYIAWLIIRRKFRGIDS